MMLLILSGVLAVLAVLVLPMGRWVLKRHKAKRLEQIANETGGGGDPKRSGQVLDRYASGVSVVEALSVLLLASGVLCLTVDTLQHRTMAEKKPDPTVERLTKLDERVRKLETPVSNVGGSASKQPGGPDPGDPKKPN